MIWLGDPVINAGRPPACDREARAEEGGACLSDDIDLFDVPERTLPSVPTAWPEYHPPARPGKPMSNGGALALGHPFGFSGTIAE